MTARRRATRIVRRRAGAPRFQLEEIARLVGTLAKVRLITKESHETFLLPKRCSPSEARNATSAANGTSEERLQRLARQAQTKKEEVAAEEAAVDRMVRRNIEQFGP